MIILTAKYTNNSGATWWIRIYDREAVAPSSTEFDCGPEFFRLKSEGDRNDTFKRIIPKTLQFKILTGCHDYTETQVEEIAAFYEALTTSFEGRFFVTASHQSDVIFRGKILPDVGDFLMQSIGDFVVTAIDGITDLQDREYRPTGYSDLVAEFAIRTWTFNQHFIDIIRRIDTIEYFAEVLGDASVSISLLATANNWIESYSVEGDIWEQVRVRNYWFEQKTPSYRKYKSCWEALTDLLTGFNAVMYYESGRYYIEQRSIQDNPPAGITYYHYIMTPAEEIIAGSGLTKVQHNYNSNDNLWAGLGATRGRLPAFKAVELTQSKQFTNYINGIDIYIPGNAGVHNFGPILGYGQKVVCKWNKYFDLGLTDAELEALWTTSPSIKFTVYYEVEIKIGDYYLKALPIPGITSTAPDGSLYFATTNFNNTSFMAPLLLTEWTLIPSTIRLTAVKNIFETQKPVFISQFKNWINYIQNNDFIIESNEISWEGDFTFEILDFEASYLNTGGITTITDAVMRLRKSSRIIMADGYNDLYEQPEGIKRYEVGDIRNSIVYSFTFGYYDSEAASINQLFMSIEGNPLFSEYPTVEWTDPDSGDTLPIQELIMKSILSMRQKPARIYSLDLYYRNNTYIGFGDQIVMYDAVTVPIEMELIASGPGGYTTYKSILWEIEKDYLGINVVDTGTPEVDTPSFPTPDGSLDQFSLTNTTSIGVEYHEEWEDITTAYLEPVSKELSSLVFVSDENTPEIKVKWALYLNGVKQTYLPDGTLIMRNWRFDIDNNRITIFKASGPIKHAEIIKYY